MKKILMSAAALCALLAAPSIADAAVRGYATANVNMRSGPSTGYPAVIVIPVGAPVTINGCMSSVNWCDVSFAGGRGWVSGNYVQTTYRSNRVYVEPNYYRGLGIPLVTFDVDNYWGRHYRDRDFYRDRDRWRGYDWDRADRRLPPPPRWDDDRRPRPPRFEDDRRPQPPRWDRDERRPAPGWDRDGNWDRDRDRDRGPDRGPGRGPDRGFDRPDRGPDRPDRGLDRPDRGQDRPDMRPDRGPDRSPDRGPDRRPDRGADRIPDRAQQERPRDNDIRRGGVRPDNGNPICVGPARDC